MGEMLVCDYVRINCRLRDYKDIKLKDPVLDPGPQKNCYQGH